MVETIKIASLQLENVKKIKAVQIEPTENGLTVIGGNNGEGKTSVLDAIAWALGGDRFKPTNPERDGSVVPPNLHVELSNGILVDRKGRNSALTVTDGRGIKGGQQLLNEFIGELALNLPKFIEATNKEKAEFLLDIIGVGDKLAKLELEEKRIYNQRYSIGRIAEQKQKYANEMPHFDGLPEAPISAIDLIKRQQAILAKNGENQRVRMSIARLSEQKTTLEEKIKELSEQLSNVENQLRVSRMSEAELIDESTAELEKDIADIDNINVRIRANLDRAKAVEDAATLKDQYYSLSVDLENVRNSKLALLRDADLPLPELSVENEELTYKGKKWDCMSSAEQLKVATAIVRQINPKCGFVLIDKLEQMDTKTLRDFGNWCKDEGLQVIATRVSTGDECSIIIEDGGILAEEKAKRNFKEGEF